MIMYNCFKRGAVVRRCRLANWTVNARNRKNRYLTLMSKAYNPSSVSEDFVVISRYSMLISVGSMAHLPEAGVPTRNDRRWKSVTWVMITIIAPNQSRLFTWGAEKLFLHPEGTCFNTPLVLFLLIQSLSLKILRAGIVSSSSTVHTIARQPKQSIVEHGRAIRSSSIGCWKCGKGC